MSSPRRPASLARYAVQLAVALGFLLGVEALAHLPLGRPAQGAAIRLAVRTAAGRIEICRDAPAEELAKLPVHMRQPRICAEQPVAYRLTLSVDGATRQRASSTTHLITSRNASSRRTAPTADSSSTLA